MHMIYPGKSEAFLDAAEGVKTDPIETVEAFGGAVAAAATLLVVSIDQSLASGGEATEGQIEKLVEATALTVGIDFRRQGADAETVGKVMSDVCTLGKVVYNINRKGE